jgi:hypothetical protein
MGVLAIMVVSGVVFPMITKGDGLLNQVWQ